MSASGSANAASYVDLDVNGTRLWGVGIDGNTSIASLKAIVSAVNRAIRAQQSAPEAASELVGA
jgi:2-isopropylmalate synthase